MDTSQEMVAKNATEMGDHYYDQEESVTPSTSPYIAKSSRKRRKHSHHRKERYTLHLPTSQSLGSLISSLQKYSSAAGGVERKFILDTGRTCKVKRNHSVVKAADDLYFVVENDDDAGELAAEGNDVDNRQLIDHRYSLAPGTPRRATTTTTTTQKPEDSEAEETSHSKVFEVNRQLSLLRGPVQVYTERKIYHHNKTSRSKSIPRVRRMVTTSPITTGTVGEPLRGVTSLARASSSTAAETPIATTPPGPPHAYQFPRRLSPVDSFDGRVGISAERASPPKSKIDGGKKRTFRETIAPSDGDVRVEERMQVLPPETTPSGSEIMTSELHSRMLWKINEYIASEKGSTNLSEEGNTLLTISSCRSEGKFSNTLLNTLSSSPVPRGKPSPYFPVTPEDSRMGTNPTFETLSRKGKFPQCLARPSHEFLRAILDDDPAHFDVWFLSNEG